MFVRRRPLMRAAVIGGSAYMIGKNKAQQQADPASGQTSAQPASAQPASGPAGPAGSPVTDQLNQLAGLHQQGALNDSEFAAAKARLLGT